MIKNIGTIEIEEIDIICGHIDVFVPVHLASNELDEVIASCKNSYKEKHPEVVNVEFLVNLKFTMGFANPEFDLRIVLFDEDNEDNEDYYEEYDYDGEVKLPDELKKELKKAIWDKLGEYLLNS